MLRFKNKMVSLKCGWCGKTFDKNVNKNKDEEYSILTCPHCARTLPASKKVSTKSFVGRKHTHFDYQSGDIVG
jgi:DNA-directed RNA polymerase subunit RPC12/RpoP